MLRLCFKFKLFGNNYPHCNEQLEALLRPRGYRFLEQHSDTQEMCHTEVHQNPPMLCSESAICHVSHQLRCLST